LKIVLDHGCCPLTDFLAPPLLKWIMKDFPSIVTVPSSLLDPDLIGTAAIKLTNQQSILSLTSVAK
jgi:hypothetical protein